MKISIVRGAFLNPFELQNLIPLKDNFDLTAFSSKKPISDKVEIKLIKLWSPSDIPEIKYKYPILNRIFGDAQLLYGLEKQIEGSDIVHVAETYFGYTYQAALARRRGKVNKLISTVWETIPNNNETLRGRKKFKRISKEAIDHYIAITERARAALIEEGVNPKKISVVNMGIDLSRFYPKFNKKKSNHINILCVARLTPEKGILDLFQAFLKLSAKDPKIWLTFIGDGPLAAELRGYKNVVIKKVPYSKIHLEYQKADIFCLPSQSTKTWEEQYGMALIEAMASGLPIITTNTGAIPEVCGSVALYASPKHPNQLAENLKELIYNVDIREKLGRLSRKRAETHFDVKQAAEKIKKIYLKIGCRSK